MASFTYWIGKEQAPLDKPPYRAYIIYRAGGESRLCDYDEHELLAMIRQCWIDGWGAHRECVALSALRRINRTSLTMRSNEKGRARRPEIGSTDPSLKSEIR